MAISSDKTKKKEKATNEMFILNKLKVEIKRD